MTDKRKRPKLSAPSKVGGNAIAHLGMEDYRKFYEVVMARNISAAETLRQLIREEYERMCNVKTW